MNIFKKIYKFIVATLAELKLVDWITRKETVRYSILVILSLILGTLFILLVDQVFILIRSNIL